MSSNLRHFKTKEKKGGLFSSVPVDYRFIEVSIKMFYQPRTDRTAHFVVHTARQPIVIDKISIQTILKPLHDLSAFGEQDQQLPVVEKTQSQSQI
jgi:hypothetical protein